MSKNLHFRTAIIIATILLFVTSSGLLAQQKSIKVGILLPLTGDFAFFGEQARHGIELAAKELNKENELVKVVYQDTKCLPREALSGFKKLITIDRVDQVLGPVCTGSIVAVAQAAKQAERYFLALLDTNRPVADSGEFTYAMGYSSEEEAELLAEHVRVSGYARIGIIFEEDAWAIGVKDAFANKFQALGGTILHEESQVVTNAASAPDYKPVITKVMKHKPEALFVVPAYNGGFFLKQLRAMGNKTPVFGPDTFAVTEVIEVAKAAANGVVCANAAVDLKRPAAKKLAETLTHTFGKPPSSIFYAGLGYDGLNFITSIAQSDLPFPQAIAQLNFESSVLGFSQFTQDRQAKLTPSLFVIRNQEIESLQGSN